MRNSFLARLASVFKAEKPPEFRAVRYWNRILVGPVVTEMRKGADGKVTQVETIIPMREIPRDRSKYKPHAGARQIARQRLGGFAGKSPGVIHAEIGFARYDIAKGRV